MAAVGHQHQHQQPKPGGPDTPPVTQLEFHQAMSDFKTMFPEMDEDVIEVVLRANNGAVDATIDQLLTMSTDNENERIRAELDATENDELPPCYSPATPPPSYNQAVPYAQSPAHVPGAVASRVVRRSSGTSPSLARHSQLTSQKHVVPQPAPLAHTPTHPDNRQEGSGVPLRIQRKWHPPLIGPLPPTFLRLDHGKFVRPAAKGKYVTVLSSAILQQRMEENERQRRNTIGVEDPELAQYLEDERIALFLQNEEFVRELMGNKEFMSTLEKDSDMIPHLENSREDGIKALMKLEETMAKSEEEEPHQCSPAFASDDTDAAFREKLKNMGKLSRRKFAQLARIFSRRKRPFKPMLGDGTNPSRDNLLLHEDEYSELSEEDSDSEWSKKDTWNSHHGDSTEKATTEHGRREHF